MAQPAKKTTKPRRPKKQHRVAQGHVDRAHRSLSKGMEAVGHMHGASLTGGASESERSRRLSTALGAGERASRAIGELRSALRALDEVDVKPAPAPKAKAKR